MMKELFSVLLVLGCVLAGLCSEVAFCDEKPGITSAAASDSARITTRLQSWAETQKSLKRHKGKIVVLDVWSTACIPCMREFPGLVKLQKRHKQKVHCISVNIDYYGGGDGPSASLQRRVLKFLTKQQATIENVICSDPDEKVYEQVPFASIPAVYVYDSAGKLRALFDNDGDKFGDEGFTYERDITPLVEELLPAEDTK
jgi:thiol-disulfide isomerase/thioredoxin